MRRLVLVVVPLIVACSDAGVTPAPPPPALHLSASDQATGDWARRVQVEVAYPNRTDAYEVLVTDLEDGVRVALAEPPRSGGLLYRAGGVPTPTSGVLSISGGSQLFDQSGAPLGLRDLDAMREQAGVPDREPSVTNPGTRGGDGGSDHGSAAGMPRLGWVITAERAAEEVADLRAHTDAETRRNESQIEFRSTDGGASQTWVFDETVGAVVRRTIERDGRVWHSIENEYRPVAGGYALVLSTSQWHNADGEVTRTVVKRFPSR